MKTEAEIRARLCTGNFVSDYESALEWVLSDSEPKPLLRVCNPGGSKEIAHLYESTPILTHWKKINEIIDVANEHLKQPHP